MRIVPARPGRPHVICAVACQGQICVAMVVCWIRDGAKSLCPVTSTGSVTGNKISDREQNRCHKTGSATRKGLRDRTENLCHKWDLVPASQGGTKECQVCNQIRSSSASKAHIPAILSPLMAQMAVFADRFANLAEAHQSNILFNN